MIELDHADLNISKQAALLYLNRSSLYYKYKICDDSELANQIHEIYLQSKCIYGYRKITASLHNFGIITNRKKVARIMREMKIRGLYPRKRINTTITISNQKFVYLLKELIIEFPNQVWATDITYIALPSGFIYLVAIIDLYSRYIIDYKIATSLDADFCCKCLDEALQNATPQIFNSDQGSQFTSIDFIQILQDKKIKISMDGRGRCFDNIFVERLWRTIKQEDVYYRRYETVAEARRCLAEFIVWYNYERLHQSLDYKTPYQIYCGNIVLKKKIREAKA
jgi:putative transposase